MEIPTHPNEEPLIHVYQLYVYRTADGRLARPAAIPFSSLLNVKKRVVEIALRSEKMENRFLVALKMLKDQENWDGCIETIRKAQVGNQVPLEFDFWWEDEPHILQ